MRRTALLVAAMLMLAAVQFGSVALATTVFVPVSGYETCTPTSGGDLWTTPDGVVHVRGEVYECTFATTSTVPYLQGGETVIINYNLDTATGSGALWGTFHSVLTGYSSETGFAGTWNGQFSAFEWSGRLVGNGYGELGGWKMRLSIQPDSPVSDYLSGFVFAPAR